MSSKAYELAQIAQNLVVNASGTITDLEIDTTNIDTLVNIDLAIAPEVLEIQVDAPAAGQDTAWLWTWEQSTLPYARRTITNSPEVSVPLYRQGQYVVNNFAAYTTHAQMTQTHTLYFKWIDGAGTDNLISWATSAGPISDTHPDINGGAATNVQRITVNVPATITPPTLTAPSVSYTVTNSGSGAYAFSGSADGDNPNLGPMYKGGTYTFNVNATGHPFYLTTDNGSNFSAGTYFGEYTSGVTGSRTDSGTVTFTVPSNAPDTLYYQCGNHSAMRGAITVKDLAVETNINGNYVVYAMHTQEGHKTPVELRPIPSLVNQMCIVYDASVGKFVPQDLATYVENTPSFENKIREVAGTAELVVEDGSAVVAKVNVYDDSTYLPLTGNNAGDQAFATDTNILYIWDGTAWQQAGTTNTNDLTEGSNNLFYTNERVDDRVAALVVGGNNITATYDDAAGTLTIDGQPGYTDTDVGTYLSTNGYDTATNIIATITDSAPTTLDTLNELAAALGDDPNFATTTANNIATKLPLAGGTMTGTIEFGDSSGADGDANLHFGASNDLQLYHNGTHSFIYDKGQGQLRVRSNYFHVLNGSNSESLLEAKTGLGVHLYYSGNEKLVTTATGVEVTGTATTDILVSQLHLQETSIPSGTTYTIPSDKQMIVESLDIIGDLDVQGTLATVSGGSLSQTTMKTQSLAYTNGATVMNLNSTGYADFVGASQIRLTLGDAGTAGTNTANWIRGTGSQLGFNTAGDIFHWEVSGNEKMRLTPSAELGLGTNSPQNVLHVRTTAAGGPQIELESASGTANSAFINFDGTSLQLSTQRDMVDGSKRDTSKSWGGINIIGQAAGSSIKMTTSEGNNNAATTKWTLSKEGYMNLTSQPSFHANGTNGSLSAGSTLVYPNVLWNVGGHYNNSNGRFTAPVTGTYLFGVNHIAATTAGVYRTYPRVNGANQGSNGDFHWRVDNGGRGGFYGDNSFFVFTWRLNAGDYIDMYQSAAPTTLYPGASSPTEDYHRFYGHLLG